MRALHLARAEFHEAGGAADDADDRHHRAAHAVPHLPAAVADRTPRAGRAGGEPGAARQLPHLRPGAGRGRLRLPADLPPSERPDPARPRPLSPSRRRPRQPRRGGEPRRLPRAHGRRGCRCCSIRAARSSACWRRSPRRRKGAPPTFLAHTNENSMAEALKFMALEGHGVAWLPRQPRGGRDRRRHARRRGARAADGHPALPQRRSLAPVPRPGLGAPAAPDAETA